MILKFLFFLKKLTVKYLFELTSIIIVKYKSLNTIIFPTIIIDFKNTEF